MNYIQGTPRDQLFLFNNCLDNLIEEDNPVRVIDAYVESLNLDELGFKRHKLNTGKPPYKNELLLKIYIYGYNERIRTSRMLEKECNRNKELIWLTEGLAPDFKTISDFRKSNKKGIKMVYKEFLTFCNSVGLLSLETIAIDGSKLRAQNSLNNIYKRNEIDNIRKRIDKKIEEYLSLLDAEDSKENEEIKMNEDHVGEIVNKLKELSKYKNKAEKIKKMFEEDEKLNTIFATDKDSRFQSDKGKVRAGYNVQIIGDNKNKLIIANDVTNDSNDLNQMSPMIEKVKEIKKDLNIEEIETDAIMDAGYFNEMEIVKNNNEDSINIIVPDKKEVNKEKKKKDNVPASGFEIDNFRYDSNKGVYVCPRKKELKKTHKNPCIEKSGRKVFEYHCYDCDGCVDIGKCTNNKRGRSIKVSINKEYMDKFKKSMKDDENKKLIEKRKEIIEHPFGTIKRTLGYTYFLLTGLEAVRTEFNLICFVYNFKRVINILGVKAFLEKLEKQKRLKIAVN